MPGVALETHGRWPLVASGAVGPVTVLAVQRPAWRPLAALLWHQTEEWVWPGGFLPWINREVIGSEEDEFPLDRRLGLGINVGFGWGFSVAAMAGARAGVPAAFLYVSHLGNAGLHISWAIRHRRYDPGTITSVATLIPVAIAGLRRLACDPNVSRRALTAGVGGGMAISVALMPLMKRRLRGARS
jgi:Protein of unknown function with HXXEE motif